MTIVDLIVYGFSALMRAEELRSGTWATVRAARLAGKRVHMVWP